MLGIIFTTLLDMVEDKMGYALVDELLLSTKLEGSYTGVGHYDFNELLKIVVALSEKTGIAIPDLLEAFGEYLFGKLMQGHASLLPDDISMIDLLSELDSNIHVEVLKLYPNATLPTFSIINKSHSHIDLLYRSPRQLEQLAVGLIKGCADYFDETCEISLETMNSSPHEVKISVNLQ